MKFIYEGYMEGYRVEQDGKVLGWVTQLLPREWFPNCKEDGCWCDNHIIPYPTRKAAAESLVTA